MKHIIKVFSLTLLVAIGICRCAQAQDAPVFHFDFSNAAGKQEISDTANKFKIISESTPFRVEKDKLNVAEGVRVAMGARFRIPAENAPDLTHQLTASAWIFKSNPSDVAPILSKGLYPSPLQFTFGLAWRYPFFYYRNAPNSYQATPGGIWHLGTFGTSQIKYPDESWLAPNAKLPETVGIWYHLAGTFQEGKVRLYINGELVAQRDSEKPELLKDDNLPFYVGAQVEKAGDYFSNFSTANMLLNDLRLYDRALNAEQIRAQYQADRIKYPGAQPEVLDVTYDYMGPEFDPTFQRKLEITRQYEKNLPADPFAGKTQMTAEIRNAATQPELVINGQREYPLMFLGTPEDYDVTYRRDIDLQSIYNSTRDFAAAGVDIVTVEAWPEYFWLGEGQYDWEKFDSLYLAQIKANPRARIMMSLFVFSPPWFEKQYADQLTKWTENGAVKSMLFSGPLGSELWYKVSMQMVRDVVDHVEKSSYANRVIGYLGGGGQSLEWYWPGSMVGTPDLSLPARDSFRVWLRARYANDAALQRAWNKEEVTLDTALIPDEATRLRVDAMPFLDPQKAGQEMDFRRYMEETTMRHVREMARIVKEVSHRKKLFLTYYGYAMASAGDPKLANSGLSGFAEVLADPNIDGFAHLNSYSRRREGEAGESISPFYASARLHNKMLWQENDYRTFIAFPRHRFNRTRTAAETVSVLQRNFGETLVNNSGLWWRLFNNSWFHHDSIMESIATMKQVGEASLPHDKTSVAQVAFIHDENVPLYMGGGSNSFVSQTITGAYTSAVRMGAPFDFYLMDDLRNHAAQIPDYKLYIFLNAWRMDSKTRAAINAKVKKNNAVAVWCYAPGYIDGDNNDKFNLDSMRSLTGFTFTSQNTTGPQRFQWKDKTHPIARLSPDAIREQPIGLTFGVTDADKVLATTSVGAALAVKELNNWRSVYSQIPLTSELLQGLCDYAGVHIYSRSYDVLYANKSYVSLYTRDAGNKTISLPQNASVREVLSGQSVAINVKQFSEQVPAATERLYLLETK